VLELPGVFGGSLSLALSSLTRARSASTSVTKASTRASKARIRAFFSDELSADKSGGEIIHELTHIRHRSASPFTQSESIYRSKANS
jgi:hypothetical protein